MTHLNMRSADARTPASMGAALIGCLAAAIAWIALMITDTGTISLAWADKDFANYWIAAKLALEGGVGDVFGPHPNYFARMQAAFGANYPVHAWSYPPHYLLTVLPFGVLGYKTALIAYLLVSFLLLCGAIRLAAPLATPPQLLLLIPAILTNVISTQNGFLISALLLAGLATRYDRPLFAGACIGLLTIKPQLGVLLPLLLLYERRWLVIAVATTTAVGLAAVSATVFGISSWRGYLEYILPYQTLVMYEGKGIFLHMMASMFGAMRSLEIPANTALFVHTTVAVAALGVWISSLRHLLSNWARAASTIFATFVVSPYSLNYDLIAMAAMAALWPLPDTHAPSRVLRASLLAVTTIPIMMPALGLAGWPIAPILIALTWLLLLRNEAGFTLGPRPNPARG